MDEVLYSIKESTLTDIGDALRRRHGETEIISVSVPCVVCKSSNTTGFDSYDGTFEHTGVTFNVAQIPNASTIIVSIRYDLPVAISLYIAPGAHDNYSSILKTDHKVYSGQSATKFELVFSNTDAVTFCTSGTASGYNYLGYYAEVIGLDADGNDVTAVEKEVKHTYSSDEVAQAIDDIEVGEFLPEEVLTLSGDCSYRFAYGGWDWFIENYGNRITTKNIDKAEHMFIGSNRQNIPFELNFKDGTNDINYMFYSCLNLQSIPQIKNCKPNGLSNLFYSCMRLRNLPHDLTEWFDWTELEGATSAYSGGAASMFQSCYSLRSIPVDLFSHMNPNASSTYTYFSNGFNYCYALDEFVNLPIPYTATFTSNIFSNSFGNEMRLKNLTFTMPDGQPYVKNWKSQILDLSKYIGYAQSRAYITNYNSGITADKEVTDDATYQALKDDPDWFTTKVEYSRYNHDSAVATINSLPDTSAYLATAGGTNTIKFKGASGSATDGGAINTLSEEEIAVATARGWTVSFA